MGRLGPATSTSSAAGDLFRTEPRAGGVRRGGLVDSALAWLGSHQEPDGTWDAEKLEEQERPLADTALACLASWGAQHHPQGRILPPAHPRLHASKSTTSRRPITMDGANLYTHAICTIGSAEHTPGHAMRSGLVCATSN